MGPYAELASLLHTPQRICITFHANPDADALGSGLALGQYLKSKGHQVQVISPNVLPPFIRWMSGANEVCCFDEQPELAAQHLQTASILFSLDYNKLSRVQGLTPFLEKFTGKKVLVDHHQGPHDVYDLVFSDPTKSSTCEMIYDLIVALNDQDSITITMGECLYAGAMTDTGSFRFPSTTSGVHSMVADLIQRGVKPAPIHEAIFDTYAENRLRFLGYVLTERLFIIPEARSAIMAVNREMMQQFDLKPGDTEGIVNYPLSIGNIIFSTFISERDSELRLSFRSKGTFDVNWFAREYFQGGGHANAAGGRSTDDIDQTITRLRALISQHQSLLHS